MVRRENNPNPNPNPNTIPIPPGRNYIPNLNSIPNPPSPNPTSIPIPPSPNPNPHQNSNSAQAASKSVQFKGVWKKKATVNETKKKKEKKTEERIKYATEIAHRSITKPNRKIWLGTYNTAEEGALAYDLASIRIKGKAPNRSIGDDGEIQIPLAPEIKESIKSEVEKRITGHFRSRSGDGSNQVESYKSDRKKVVPRANDAASASGSGAKTRGRRVKKQ